MEVKIFGGGKAAPKRTSGDTIPSLKPENTKTSNQVQFKDVQAEAVPVAHAASNQIQLGPNTKGTGREDVPSAVALFKKRRLNVKMPANFNG